MAIRLALLELGSLFAVVFGVLSLSPHPIQPTWVDFAGVLGQSTAMTLCLILTFYYNDLYDFRIVRSLGEFIPRLLKSLLFAFLLLAIFYTAFPQKSLTGAQFALSLAMVTTVILGVRTIGYSVMSRQIFSDPVLILGTGPLARKIADEIETAPDSRYFVLGLIDENADNQVDLLPVAGYPVLGNIDCLEDTIRKLHPARIIVALRERRGRLPVRELLASSVNGTVVEDGHEVFERATGKLAIENLNPSTLLFSDTFKKTRTERVVRRAYNLVLAGLGLVLVAPLMALIAVFVKMESEGPVFFVQERAGLGGNPFRLFKFRTMRELRRHSDSIWDRDNRSRLTRFGKWLRDTHLDELPQFLNVLKGDMDLVGPRPEMATNVRAMEEEIPYYAIRHSVRPGLTGWAQVRHGYSVTLEDVTEKIRYDLYYIKNMSFWLDLRILIDTAKIMVFGHNAS